MQPCRHFLLNAVGSSLIGLRLLTLLVSQYEDVGLLAAEETMTEEQQVDFSGISGPPGMSRRQILAAQFECYLKIIKEPPRTDAGDGLCLCCQVLCGAAQL